MICLLLAASLIAQQVRIWETDGDQLKLLAKRVLPFVSEPVDAPFVITVDNAKTYQTMDGFGASMTHSSASVIARLSKADRKLVMRLLFRKAGISLLRQPMGASDFTARGNFSYQDSDNGEFSIAADEEFTIPLLKEARTLNPSLKIFALPWSPPAWMKTTGTMNGGSIRQDRFDALARYFVQFLDAYRKAGVPVDTVSMQNEPMFQTPNYPSSLVTAADQALFLGQFLGPALASSGTRILAYDHNWDHPEYPAAVLSDPQASQYVAGTAFHCYGGDVGAQLRMQAQFPGKGIWFTECSGTVGSSFAGDLAWNARNLFIGATRNWASGVTLWNLVLDPDSGPVNGGCAKCRGVLTVDPATGQVTRNVEYYLLAHAARFIRPGAVRIDSNDGKVIRNVAFANPDGSIAVLVLNDSNAAAQFAIAWHGRGLAYSMPGQSLATFVWRN